MSFLFPMELRELGTLDVESFGSYIHRLSHAHGVTASRMLKDVCGWYRSRHVSERDELPSFHNNGGLPTYIRPNKTTAYILKAFSKATGRNDLRSGTFLAFNNALRRSSNTFSGDFRWCPACMKEHRRMHDDGYYKLYWSLLDITHCPIHGVEIITQCQSCGSKQGGLGHKNFCRKCLSCGNNLDLVNSVDKKLNSWSTQGSDLLKLVEEISQNPDINYPDDGVRKVVNHLYNSAWDNKDEEKFWNLIPRDECIGIALGDVPISLLIARRTASRLGMSLIDILLGEVDVTSDVLSPLWFAELPKQLRPKKRRRANNRDIILNSLLEVRKKAQVTSPMPLYKIAAELKVSKGYLHYQFPIIANKISCDYRKWKIEQRLANQRIVKEKALSLFTSNISDCIPVSRKKAFKTIRDETGFPKNLIRDEINIVYKIVIGVKQ